MTLEEEIRLAIEKIFRTAKTGQSLRRLARIEIEKIIKQKGALAQLEKSIDDNDIQPLLKKILKELDIDSFEKFRQQYEANPDQRSAILNTQMQIINTLSKNCQRIDRLAVREIAKSIGTADNWRDAVRSSLIKAGRLRHHAETELETTLAAMDSASIIFDAIKVEGASARFRYEGPSGTRRPFCRTKVGKIFSLDEIKKMVNSHGLPALYYRGGYNCRHRWVAVISDVTNILKKNIFELQHKKQLNYRRRDLLQDLRKHASKHNLDQDSYVSEAIAVVKNSKIIAAKKRFNKWQYEFYGDRGYSVTDFDGTIRRYYFSENINKTLLERSKKVHQWKRLK